MKIHVQIILHLLSALSNFSKSGNMNLLMRLFLLLVLFITQKGYCHLSSGLREYEVEARMPFVVSEEPDALHCTSVKLNPREAYIVKFTPHASKRTAHHMMIYGCEEPASRQISWKCHDTDSASSPHSVCGNGEERQILFAWALDAPAKELPKGVGFRVSGGTRIKHIVIQLHYARKFTDGETDNSGVTLHLSLNRPPQQMGYYILAHTGTVEPRQKEIHLETACVYKGDYPVYPIGYRTHSHNLGVVTSGYRIRDGKWTEIGRMSPQLPQTFYPVTNPGMDIRDGDVLAARCTMNSMSRINPTFMGPANHDEMCNFYIMYSTYNQANLATTMCIPPTPDFDWKGGIKDLLPPPSNVSSLKGIQNAENILAKFNQIQ